LGPDPDSDPAFFTQYGSGLDPVQDSDPDFVWMLIRIEKGERDPDLDPDPVL
jgi:hypothetical protein